MQKTKIEWANYVANPVKGICKMNCPYCYAIRMYKRFKWNPEIRYDNSVFKGLERLHQGDKIFVGSTHDIFGEWIPNEWIENILATVKLFPWLTFIFLTKNPKRYNNFQFPKNAWLGYSTTGTLFHKWDEYDVQNNDNIKFVSLEPMQQAMNASLQGFAQRIDFDWLIVGKETGNRQGKYIFYQEWLSDIYNFADKTNIPLFLKNNIGAGRQEFPEAIK